MNGIDNEKNAHIAHLIRDEDDNIKRIQTAAEHCKNTAKYTEESLQGVGLAKLGYLVGLTHDMGKFCIKFDRYIRDGIGKKGSVNHTFAGVIYILTRYHDPKDNMQKLTAELIAWAIGSHHGQFDCIDLDGKSGFLHRVNYKDKTPLCYEEAVQDYLSQCASEDELDRLFFLAKEEVTQHFKEVQEVRICLQQNGGDSSNIGHYLLGQTARLVLSALIDADRRDTQEFTEQKPLQFTTANESFWAEQLACFNETSFNNFKTNANTTINQVRQYISDESAKFAAREPAGIYKLSVPTGAGKTLTTLRFALQHAKSAGKKRIIFVIPLLSVLDQNVKEIMRYTTEHGKYVSQHHSNVLHEKTETENKNEPNENQELKDYELLMQTWETPILVTTLVQLLNTLFSGKTTAIRRMKSLCDSVIVIDEVQTVPFKLLYMFNMTMNYLTHFCGATIVLSSATHPEFGTVKYPMYFGEQPNIVQLNDEQKKIFDRVRIIDKTRAFDSAMSIEKLSDFSHELIQTHASLLVICNTKRSALSLYKELSHLNTNAQYKLFHLSTAMCMKHREEVLEQIISCLKNKDKIIVISTQLVEAGIDFSFESVIRIKAGIDNITQAAGRCNRHGEFGHPCPVYIISLDQESEKLTMLKDIQKAQAAFTVVSNDFGRKPERYGYNLLGDKGISAYYLSLFKDQDSHFKYNINKKNNLFFLLSFNNKCAPEQEKAKQYMYKQSFKTAGKYFKVFDEDTHEIIVPYNDEARGIILALSAQKAKYDLKYVRKLIKGAKPYTLQIYTHQYENLLEQGALCDRSDQAVPYITLISCSHYTAETGLLIDPTEVNPLIHS